jgi:uncharacterized protein (TIGR00369 family)
MTLPRSPDSYGAISTTRLDRCRTRFRLATISQPETSTNSEYVVSDNADLIERSGDAYKRCFACGTENPMGLQLHFRAEDGGARAVFRPRPEYQGWDNLLHGGIILTMLDETLAYAALFDAGHAVTAEITARIRRPGPMDQTYSLFGKVMKRRRRLILAHATIEDAAGNLIAEADGKFMLRPDVV